MEYQKFSPKQLTTMTWWGRDDLSGRDGVLCDGAIRSGKTMSAAVGFFLWSMTEFDGAQFALCGKTIESLRRNVVQMLPGWLEPILRFEERRSENRLTVTYGPKHNDYYLFGGRDESSYQLIQGITLAGVLLDEAALMPRSFVEQALARCSVAGSKFWFNCNPAGPNHWFYKEWVQKAEEKNLLYLHYTMQDNPSLAPQIRRRYEGMYSGVFYDRYIRGLWTAAEGVVYDMFDPGRHVCAVLPELEGQSYVSVDYGTQNPTVFLLWRKSVSGAWVCVREYYWSGREQQRQKTDGEYARDLLEFLGEEKPRAVIVDPSAASFLAQLRELGLRVLRADNAVVDGIRNVSQMLRQGKLLFSDRCAHTLSEFRDYLWDAAAAERGEDRPLKEHDHCMDALRYFVHTALRRGEARVGRRPTGL